MDQEKEVERELAFDVLNLVKAHGLAMNISRVTKVEISVWESPPGYPSICTHTNLHFDGTP